MNQANVQDVTNYLHQSQGLCLRQGTEMSQTRDIVCVRQIHILQEKMNH